MKVDWLIVGAGFTGCTLAERIATQLDQKVLLIDRRNHVGGNAYDYHNQNGILLHKYGPHIFHTNSKKVWDYLSAFTDWRPYHHRVLAVVEGKKVPVPFNLNSLRQLFPESLADRMENALLDAYGFGVKVPILRMREHENADLRTLADYIYRNVFYSYTVKQWELKPEELDPSVTGRVPVYVSRDDRYFQDTYQAMPRFGYSALFEKMLDHRNIRILLNTDFRELDGLAKFKRMVYTGPVDDFFDHLHGHLPYRSLRFDFVNVDDDRVQECGTVNYPNDYDFTRITEQKYLSGQKLPGSTLVVEYPQKHVPGKTEPYYPIPREENRLQYNRYLKEVEKLNGTVLLAGRLADYKYYNMDQAVAHALKVFEDSIAARRTTVREAPARVTKKTPPATREAA
ncbi:MAG TPA: UDP-galactopyranose mutase [Bryobacteraceae bacterium]|nr:UDP-galactopyranose mutase [Bryobacteraceae bacterium]